MWFLAILGVLTSVVGCFYYLRIIKVMFFDPTEPAFDRRAASVSFVAVASGAFTVFFLFGLAPFTSAAGAAAKVLFG
jgi:NADH-quinone oxidoreductase subunit N